MAWVTKIIGFGLFFFSFSFGTIAYNGKVQQFTMPDGSRLPINLYGAYPVVYGESPEGYSLVRRSDGWYYYADVNEMTGDLVPGYIRYTGEPYVGPYRLKGLRSTSRAEARRYNNFHSLRGETHTVHGPLLKKSASGINDPEDIHLYPARKGTVKGLVMLVDFSDSPQLHSQQAIDDFLNKEGYTGFGNNGSVRDFYLYASHGKMSFENTVTRYYRANNPKSYYESGTSTNVELMHEAIEYFDGEIDFSEFDNDGDGTLESIAIIYAGAGQAFGSGIWPHRGNINYDVDGVRIRGYQITDSDEKLGIYVFAHETGHLVFNWPDLYGTGDQGLMGSRPSETNPAPPNDVYRMDQGWIDVIDLDETSNGIYPSAANGPLVYRWRNLNKSGEAFVWSNRSNENRYDILRGSGLQIYHFDYQVIRNSPPAVLSLALVQADGQDELGSTNWPLPGSDANDYFYEGHNSEFNDNTTPSARWNDGSNSGLNISQISATGQTMTFGVGPNPVEEIVSLGQTDAGNFAVENLQVVENGILISVTAPGMVNITITNVRGEILAQGNHSGNLFNSKIGFNGPQGVYFLKVRTADGQSIQNTFVK